MFERFSDRARKVMALAHREAQRFNHEYIGTEHILLGIAKEGNGVGANVLRNMGVDVKKLRDEIGKLVKNGPDKVTKGKLPQTPRAKNVIEWAINEARALDHHYIGTEHLLLGLLQVKDGIACQVLNSLGVSYAKALEEIIKLLGPDGSLETTPETIDILNRSWEHTTQDEDPYEQARKALRAVSGKNLVKDNELIAEQLDNIKKKNDIIDDIFKKDQDPMAQRMKLANLLIHDPDLLDVLDNVKVILDRIAEKKEES